MKNLRNLTFVPLLLLLLAVVLTLPTGIAHEHNVGPKWWQKECENDWKRSSAKQTCYGAEIKHDGTQDNYNMCYVRATCIAERGAFHVVYNPTEFRGRNVDLRNLSNCGGHFKVGSC